MNLEDLLVCSFLQNTVYNLNLLILPLKFSNDYDEYKYKILYVNNSSEKTKIYDRHGKPILLYKSIVNKNVELIKEDKLKLHLDNLLSNINKIRKCHKCQLCQYLEYPYLDPNKFTCHKCIFDNIYKSYCSKMLPEKVVECYLCLNNLFVHQGLLNYCCLNNEKSNKNYICLECENKLDWKNSSESENPSDIYKECPLCKKKLISLFF